MINWKEAFDTAASALAVVLMAMGIMAAAGAAVFFWELAMVVR